MRRHRRTWTAGRVRSAADLDYAGRKAVLNHLKARGFDATASKVKRPSCGEWVNNAAADRQAMLRKLAVMLKDANCEKAYVVGIAKQMFSVDLVEFCKPDQLHRIVSALGFDRRRRAEKAQA